MGTTNLNLQFYDAASQYRYNYARANPANFVDPSERSANTENLLILSLNSVAESTAVTALGYEVRCAYYAEASALHLVDEHMDQDITQLGLLMNQCAAQITVSQFARATAGNLLFMGAVGVAGRGIGWLLESGEQGMAGAFTAGAPWLDGVSNYTEGGTFLQCGQSCVSATGQILSDGAVSESQLVQQLGQPARPLELPQVLNQIGTSGQWTGNYFLTDDAALNIANQGQFGAVLQSPGVGAHMVTIEPIVGSNMFLVTDTGVGATYEVTSDWIQQYVSAGVWRVGQ